MNEREQLLVRAATDRLRPVCEELIAAGWQPELIVFAPSEIERLPGYKVALVVPVDSVPEAENSPAGSQE